MPWFILLLAGLLEIAWAVGLKATAGFSKPWAVIFTLVSLLASLVLLGFAMRDLPVGTAYAVWTGIGAVGVAVFGIAIHGEPATIGRLVSLLLIVSGVVGLKLTSHV